jgi:prolyl-tRNA synthetase
MGCYGIGVNRILAAAIETYHDDNGIIWPISIAPYQVTVIGLGRTADDEVSKTAEKLAADLEAAGIDVLLDDRDQRPGVKFKDADLLGIPVRVTVGQKTLAEGKVELKLRRESEVKLIDAGNAAETIKSLVEKLLAELK